MPHRRYLTSEEVNALLEVSRLGRHGKRNHCLIFMGFRHGFRISELLSLHIHDVDLETRQLYARRLKNGFSTIHPFDEHEAVIIRQWLVARQSYSTAANSTFLFISERNSSLSRKQAWSVIKESGIAAGLAIAAHPHMLRHACGYILANNGADTRLIQDYLGHKNIRHTVHYTKGNSERFSALFKMSEKARADKALSEARLSPVACEA